MKRTMTPDFNPTLFRGDLMNGKLRAAMDYLSQFPAQSERYARYAARFQEGRCEAPTGEGNAREARWEWVGCGGGPS